MNEVRRILEQMASCKLTDDNCASFEVANRRIRALACRALAALDEQPQETGPLPWFSEWTTNGRYCVVQEVDRITVTRGAGVAWDDTEFDKVRAALGAASVPVRATPQTEE